MLPCTAWKNKPTDNLAEQCHPISHKSVTMEAQVLPQASPCGIYVGQSCNGTGFSHNTSVLHGQYYSTNSPHSLIHSFIPVQYMLSHWHCYYIIHQTSCSNYSPGWRTFYVANFLL